MRALVHLSPAVFRHPPSLARISTLAWDYAVVLVCPQCHTRQVTRRLTAALPHHRIVALPVDGEIAGTDRRVIEALLAEGVVPLVLIDAPPAPNQLANWLWLGAEVTLTLPARHPVQ